jgi:hypothetical protein
MGGFGPPSLMREAIKILAEKYKNPCVPVYGAEIGVYLGQNSQVILENIPASHLHLVEDLSEMKPSNTSSENWTDKLGMYLKDIPASRYTWHIMTSADASMDIKDNSLDFVYIDANHSYSYVLQDCRLWWPKVKNGGVLCGHDYSLSFKDYRGTTGTHVKEAVEVFTKEMNLALYHGQNVDDQNFGHSPIHDWWVFKDA